MSTTSTIVPESDRCPATNPGGGFYRCSLWAGHAGDHKAYVNHEVIGEAVSTWPNVVPNPLPGGGTFGHEVCDNIDTHMQCGLRKGHQSCHAAYIGATVHPDRLMARWGDGPVLAEGTPSRGDRFDQVPQWAVVEVVEEVVEEVPGPGPEVIVEQPTTDALQGRIDLLEAERVRLVDENSTLTNTVTSLRRELSIAGHQHRNDINTISERFIEEANNRGWCSEYDSIIADINGNLNIPMRVRRQDYRVTVTVHFELSTTVEATDEDDAIEQATRFGFSRIEDRNGNWSVDDYNVDDYEAEVE